MSTAYAIALINSGEQLRRLREARFLQPEELERTSRWVSELAGCSAYYISRDALAEIESGASPSIHQVHSLALCLGVSYKQVLQVFGIDLKDDLQPAKLRKHFEGADNSSPAPDVHGRDNDTSKTHLLGPDPEHWGEMGLARASCLRPERFRYVLVGSNDDFMADVIAPGSLVEVDELETQVQSGRWHSLRERPLYVVRHQGSMTCGWCQLQDDELTLVPHPLSRRGSMHFKTPESAQVLGRIVRVWTPPQPEHSKEPQSAHRYSLIGVDVGYDSSSILTPLFASVTRSVA